MIVIKYHISSIKFAKENRIFYFKLTKTFEFDKCKKIALLFQILLTLTFYKANFTTAYQSILQTQTIFTVFITMFTNEI